MVNLLQIQSPRLQHLVLKHFVTCPDYSPRRARQPRVQSLQHHETWRYLLQDPFGLLGDYYRHAVFQIPTTIKHLGVAYVSLTIYTQKSNISIPEPHVSQKAYLLQIQSQGQKLRRLKYILTESDLLRLLSARQKSLFLSPCLQSRLMQVREILMQRGKVLKTLGSHQLVIRPYQTSYQQTCDR